MFSCLKISSRVNFFRLVSNTIPVTYNQESVAGCGLPFARVDFNTANFVNSNLQGAILDGGNFQRAFFVNANLGGVSVVDADFQQALLQGANLRAVNFQSSDLRGAIFGGANLEGADLSDADLSGADLRGAYSVTPEQLATAYLDDETQLPEFDASPVYFSGASPMFESPFPDLPLFVEQGR